MIRIFIDKSILKSDSLVQFVFFGLVFLAFDWCSPTNSSSKKRLGRQH